MLHRGPSSKAASTVVKYGDFAFHENGLPTPFVTMDQEMLNDHSGRWGRVDNITINGIISGQHFSGESNYGSGLIGLQSGLIDAFSADFNNFVIQDSGSPDMDTVYSGDDCIIGGISFEESRYNMILGYSVNLRAFQYGYFEHKYGVLDPVDEFSYDEQQEDEVVTLTHNVSARGFRSGDAQAFDNAKDFVISRTGLSKKVAPHFITTGADGENCDTWVLRNQSETIDRVNATYSVSELYEMDPSGCNPVVVKYTCSLESGIQDDFVRGSIQGEVNAGKTGTMTQARNRLKSLDMYNLFTGAINIPSTEIDFYKIPVTFNSEEVSVGTKGEKKITFNASYDNNNLFNNNNYFFKYNPGGSSGGPCYFDYNVDVSFDEVTEVASVNLNGTIKARGNLAERINKSNDFLTNYLSTGDNGTGRLRDLANEVYQGISGDLNISGYALNIFPNSLSIVSGNKGNINISASYDNSDRIYDPKIRGSSYSIDVKTALPVYKPRASVNENGAFGIYETNVFNREVVNINGQVIPDHRASSLEKDNTVEASGSGIINTVRTALVSGQNKRLESDTSSRSETDGSLSFGNSYSFDSSGVYVKANTKLST